MPSDESPRASKVTCRRFGTATKVDYEKSRSAIFVGSDDDDAFSSFSSE